MALGGLGMLIAALLAGALLATQMKGCMKQAHEALPDSATVAAILQQGMTVATVALVVAAGAAVYALWK